MRVDTVVVGFHETSLPDALGSLPPDDPLGHYYRTSVLRVDDVPVEPLVALSRLNAEVTRADALHHWTETAPLAAHLLVARLRERGFTVEMLRFFDAEHERLGVLLDEGVRTVCIPTTFYVDPLPIMEIVRFVRERRPDVRIVVGGPFVHDLFRERSGRVLERSLVLLGADIAVRSIGGEATLARVLAALRDDRSLEDVPNLALCESGGRVRFTREEPDDAEIHELIDWDLLSDDEIGGHVNFRTALSCAFACDFCEFPVRAGEHRAMELAVVEAQLEKLARRRVRTVCFVDDTFNVPLPRFEALCRMLVARRFGFRWSSHFRASSGDRPPLYRTMREAGCAALHLGLESADEGLLREMRKPGSVEQYERTLEHCHTNGILTHAALLVGFPGENDVSLAKTIDFVNRTEPTTFRPQPFFFHHHAPVARRAQELGLEGRGWTWRHRTMTSREAVAASHAVRMSITGSRFTGDRQTHVFMLPWLLSKGVSQSDLCEALSLVDRIQRVSFGDDPVCLAERAILVVRLRALAHRLRLGPARFSLSSFGRLRPDGAILARLRAEYHALGEGMADRRPKRRGLPTVS